MKHCILQDSSFLVATLDKSDEFHNDAVLIFKKLIENKRDLRIVVPSLVFYETIITLIKRGGVPKEEIERKLWRFLYSGMVLNVSLIETNAFRVCKRLSNLDLSKLNTQDFIIVNVGFDYEAQILTFDKNMRKRVGQFYPEIYYCSEMGDMEDESLRFIEDLNKKLGKDGINLDDIPF